MYNNAFSASPLVLKCTYPYPFGRLTALSITNSTLTTSPKLLKISFKWPSLTFLLSFSTWRTRDSRTGEGFLGGGEGLLDCGGGGRGGDRPRLAGSAELLRLGGGGLRLRLLELREGEREEEEKDLEREREREEEREEEEREEDPETEPDGGERRARPGFAIVEERERETLYKP